MAGSVNKVILVGNLGRDPEVRRTGAGDPIVSFSVATSESWRDKASGERKERTEWHNIVIFNVRGNNYRLETQMTFGTQIVAVKWIGTHAEYDCRYA